MKVTIQNSSREIPHTYPYIGCFEKGGTELYVLFTGPKKGFLLKQYRAVYSDFEHRTDWSEDEFTIFAGTVTLTNV